MPPVFLMPVPECHHQEHRHPPAKDSRVENVVRAAPSPNFFETFDLLWGHWPGHLQPTGVCLELIFKESTQEKSSPVRNLAQVDHAC